jgi:hypothetical protein
MYPFQLSLFGLPLVALYGLLALPTVIVLHKRISRREVSKLTIGLALTPALLVLVAFLVAVVQIPDMLTLVDEHERALFRQILLEHGFSVLVAGAITSTLLFIARFASQHWMELVLPTRYTCVIIVLHLLLVLTFSAWVEVNRGHAQHQFEWFIIAPAYWPSVDLGFKAFALSGLRSLFVVGSRLRITLVVFIFGGIQWAIVGYTLGWVHSVLKRDKMRAKKVS